MRWLAPYSGGDALGDLIAGLTVGLALIPQVNFVPASPPLLIPLINSASNNYKLALQAIAYAGLAGMSPQYGLHVQLFRSKSDVRIIRNMPRGQHRTDRRCITPRTYTYARYDCSIDPQPARIITN